jgi:hypothetical protein
LLSDAEQRLVQARRAFAEKDFLRATRRAEEATAAADCARIEDSAKKAEQDAELLRQTLRTRLRCVQ